LTTLDTVSNDLAATMLQCSGKITILQLGTSNFLKVEICDVIQLFLTVSTYNYYNHSQLSGLCLEQPRWACTRRNIFPLTPTCRGHQSSLICFLHVLQFMSSSLL